MPPRFRVPGPVTVGNLLALPDNAAHHLARVLRLPTGAEITLFTGEGGEFTGRIESVGKKQVTVMPLSFDPVNREPMVAVHLGLCILKRDAMDAAADLSKIEG